MKTVVVAWHDMRVAASQALEMSAWCRSQGLQRDIDFDWYFDQDFQKTRFRFFGEHEQFATMFALKWIGA